MGADAKIPHQNLRPIRYTRVMVALAANPKYPSSAAQASPYADADGAVNMTDLNIQGTQSGKSIERGRLSGSGNIVGYAGYIFEPATGMYMVRHRWYSTDNGRWLSRDPLGYVDGTNMHAYVQGSPIAYLDSFGLQSGAPAVRPPVVRPRTPQRYWRRGPGRKRGKDRTHEPKPYPMREAPPRYINPIDVRDIEEYYFPRHYTPPPPYRVVPAPLPSWEDINPDQPYPQGHPGIGPSTPSCKPRKHPDQTCSDEILRDLHDNIQVEACKGARQCKKHHTCDQLADYFRRNILCMKARWNVMEICFKSPIPGDLPGDKKHWNLVLDRYSQMQECAYLYTLNGCSFQRRPIVPEIGTP